MKTNGLFRWRTGWVLLWGLFAACPARADLTNTWPFTTPGNYVVSDPALIEVAEGVAKLKLQRAELYVAAISNYQSAGMVVSNLSVGPDTALMRAAPYSYPSVFTSRILDGGAGNIWRRIHSPVRAAAGVNAGGSIPTNYPGLVFCYRMDDDLWIDSVSGLLPSVGSGASFTTDAKLGPYAGRFNANAQDYVLDSRVALLNGATEYSVSCWIKPAEYRVSGIVAAQQPNAAGLIQANPDFTRVAFHVNALSIQTLSGVTPLNEWSFVVGTWRSSDGMTRIYINGVLSASGVLAKGQTLSQGGNWYVSGVPAGYRFRGVIDEACLYNRALSESEVLALYLSPKSVLFQVRSANTAENLAARNFVGTDGSAGTFYVGNFEDLSTLGDFKVFERYVQYRAYLYGPSARSDVEPFIDSVMFLGTPRSVADNTLADFGQGDFTSSVTNYPSQVDAPHLGLSKLANGGYPQNGTYVSPAIDAGAAVLWYRMRWGVPLELTSTGDSSMIGLWRVNGDWSDATAYGHGGTGSNVTFTSQAKLGTASAVFNGINSHAVISGALATNRIKALEFWISNNRMNNGILQLANNATNRMFLVVSNGLVTPMGFSVIAPPQVYVNGNDVYRKLQPGWNHVALVSEVGLPVTEFIVGRAGDSYLDGLMDDIAMYRRNLDPAEIKGRSVSGVRAAAGRARLQVRSSDIVPIPASVQFVGNDGTASSFFDVTAAGGANLPGVVYNRRYFQYRIAFEGDGNSTPAVSFVTVSDLLGNLLFRHDTLSHVAAGDFDGGKIKWTGDELALADRSAVPGLVNLETPIAGLQGLWHCDETNWSVGASITDSSGNSLDGTAYSGAQVSLIAKVGFGAGRFDGVDDYATLPSVLLDGDYSFMFWFKTDAIQRGALLSRSDGSVIVEMNSDGVSVKPGILTVVCHSGSHDAIISSAHGGLNDGQWHHVALLSRGGNINLYLDGVSVGTGVFNPPGSLGYSDIMLLRHPTAGTFMKGYLDEIALFSRGLTESDIRRFIAVGHDTVETGSFQSRIFDAGGAAIWELMKWRENVGHGDAIAPASANSLAGLWRFEEGGGPVAIDSAEGNDGTLVGGASRSMGRLGRGLALGGGAHVEVSDSLGLEPTAVTVEAWVMPTVLGEAMIVDKHNGLDAGYALGINESGTPFWRIGSIVARAMGGVQAGGWSHLTGVYDGTMARLYHNGALVGESSGALMDLNAGALWIGAAVGGGRGFEGTIDEVAVHGRALSPREIMDHAQAGSGVLRFQARAGNDPLLTGSPFVGVDGTTNTFFEIGTNSIMMNSLPLGQYFQFRAYLSAEDGLRAPRLQGMTVNQSRYPTEHPWVAPADGQGASFVGRLLSFSHYLATNVESAVRYQLSGDNGTNWYYWNNTQWTNDDAGIGWNLANTRGIVAANIRKFYDQLYQGLGGTFKFRAFLDSDGATQTALDWVEMVKSKGRIVVLEPNGAERANKAWVVGVPYTIRWSSTTNSVTATNIIIELYNQSGSNFVSRLASGITNSGSYATIINNDARDDYRIRIRDGSDATIEDWSDQDFELIFQLHLTQPNGGERRYIGQTNRVTWVSPGPAPAQHVGSPLTLWFSQDGGTNWFTVYDPTNNPGINVLDWVTPSNQAGLVSENARMAISTPAATPETAYKFDITDDIFTNAGIVVTYPSAGAGVKMGNLIDIEWVAAGAGAGGVKIEFFNGVDWSNVADLATCVPGTNAYPVRLTAPNPTQGARIKITANDDPDFVWGISDEFTLADINIVSPVGGTPASRDQWQIGTTNYVKWTAGGAGGEVHVEYSVNGTNWLPIVMSYTNVNSSGATIYTNVSPPWIIPGPPSSNAQVRVRSISQVDLVAVTEFFDISGVQISSPNGSEIWEFGATNLITWLHQGAGANVGLDLAFVDNPQAHEFEMIEANQLIFDRQKLILPAKVRRPSNFARARIRSLTYDSMFDVSDSKFTIRGLSVVSPSSNSLVTMSRTATNMLQWFSAATEDTTAEWFYSSDGTNYSSVQFGTGGSTLNQDAGAGSNQTDWAVSRQFVPSPNARVKVVAGAYNAVSPRFTLRGIRVLRPAATQMLTIGAREALQWEVAGVSASSYVSNDLSVTGMGGPYTNANLPGNVFLSGRSVFWDVDPEVDPSTNAVIRMRITTPVEDTDVVMFSDPFVLRGLKMKTPGLGAVWNIGSAQTVSFLAAGMGVGARADLHYSPDGVTYDLASPVTNAFAVSDGLNSFTWNIEGDSRLTRMPSTNAHVRVVSGSYTNVSKAFTLRGIKVTAPRGTDIWAVSDGTNTIRWSSVGAVDNYTIGFTVWNGTNVDHTEVIASGISGTQYDWTMTPSAIGSNVTIYVTDGSYVGISEVFEIVAQPSIRIISPRSGDFWKSGLTNAIRWSQGGKMSNDFWVAYSTYSEGLGDFVVTNEIQIGPCDFADGVYTVPWVVPTALGRTRIIVTNRVDELVKDQFENFEVAARFDIQPFQVDLYALEGVGIEWATYGVVLNGVDLYYSLDPQRAPWSWVLINTNGPFMNVAHAAPSLYGWTVANAKTPTAWIRIQDHAFATNRFDASVVGPYDDLGTFAINYYSVTWNVYDRLSGAPLDRLSVSDSSGWSAAALASPVVHEYPYGFFDTVWFREYFHDYVVFNWSSKSNRTIDVYMNRSELAQNYAVLGDFTYDSDAAKLTIHSWIERGGQVLSEPTKSTIEFFDVDGAFITNMVSTAPSPTGVFRMEWPNVTNVLRYGETYYAKVQIEYSLVTYSSVLTYTLRLPLDQQDMTEIISAIGESQVSVSNILDNVSSNLSNVATNVLGVASNIESLAASQAIFRSNVTDRLDSMTGALDTVSMGITNLLSSMGTFTNDAASMLNAMTTNLEVMLPAITNLDARLPQIEADLLAARARILTRPSTVVYGSTNLFLYKSTAGYGNLVTLTVSNDLQGEVFAGAMTEILNGIYQLDGLVANWGTNRYVLTCMDPAGARARGWDSVGFAVVPLEQQAALEGLATLTNDLARIEGRLTNLAASVQNIDTGLSAVVGDILVSVTNVENTISGLTNLSDVATILGAVDWSSVSNLGALAGTMTNILGRVINIETVVGDLTNLAQAANALTNVNWDAVTNIASLAADLSTTMTSVTNIEAMIGGLADLASLTAAITNLTGALTNLPDLVAMGTNLATLAQAMGGVDFNDLGDRMTNLAAVVNGMGDLNALKDQITNMVAAVSNMQDLNTLATNVSDLVAVLGGVDLTGLGNQITNLTTLMTGMGDLTALQSQITNMVAAIQNMQDLSTLGSNVASLVQSLGVVDLADFGDRMTNLTSAIASIGDLSQLQSDITNMVRVVDEMTDLNTLGSNVTALVQSLGGVDLAEFGTQMTNLTALMVNLGDLTLLQDQITNMVAAIQSMQDLSTLGSNVASLVQSLGTVDLADFGARMTNLTAAIGSIGDLTQLQNDITNMVAAVNSMQDLSVLGSNVASLVQSMGGVDLDQLGVRMTNLTAAIGGMADVTGLQTALSNIVVQLGDLTNLNALAGVNWDSITNLAGVATDVQTILASVTNTEQLVGDLTNLQSVASSLAGVNWSSISNLTGMAGDLQTILISVTNTEEAVGGLTNLQSVVEQLAGVNWGAVSNLAGVSTNVETILATVTNTQQAVSALSALLAVDFSGLTNLPGMQQNVGDIRTAVTNLQSAMAAVTGVDWGNISGLLANITNQMGAMQWSDITDLRTRMGNVQTTLTALPDVRTGVSNVWLAVSRINWSDVDGVRDSMATLLASVGGAGLGTAVADIQARLAGLDLSGVEALAAQIGNPGDGAGTRTLFGQIAAVEQGVAQAGSDAADAATKAGAARGEAAKAATAVQDLKAELAAGNLAGAAAKLDEIRDFMSRAKDSMGALDAVPEGLGGLDTQLRQLNSRFEQLAAAGGFRFTDSTGKPTEGGVAEPGTQPPAGETPPSGALTQESIQSLSQRIDEVRDRMSFLQKMIEEMRDVPLVETSLLGAP